MSAQEKDACCGCCKYYIDGGDWGLCCELHYDLCYRETPACHDFEFSREKIEELKRKDGELAEYIRRAKAGDAYA